MSQTQTRQELAKFREKVIGHVKWLVIGHPSQENLKATGLWYSAEWYEKNAKNASKEPLYRLNAEIAHKVLTSDELKNLIENVLIPKFVDERFAEDKVQKSDVAVEDKEQEKLAKKVSADAKKVAPKRAPRKAPAKKAATKKTPTTAKKVTVKPARKTTKAKA